MSKYRRIHRTEGLSTIVCTRSLESETVILTEQLLPGGRQPEVDRLQPILTLSLNTTIAGNFSECSDYLCILLVTIIKSDRRDMHTYFVAW